MTGKMVFVGVDTTAGPRPLTYAILDERLDILDLGEKPAEEVAGVIAAYSQVVCGVDAPIMPNQGLLADQDYRRRVGLDPARATYSTYRVGEYELRRRGIYIYNTPPDPERVPRWMKESWRFYDLLRAKGFVDYPQTGRRRLFETYPHAAFTVLIKRRPYPKTSVEGRLQRQLILYQEGVGVRDPMYILEEWTPHHFLRGQLNMKDVHSHDELDALVAAYTAFLLEKEPHHVTAVGDQRDGQIIVPTGELQDSY